MNASAVDYCGQFFFPSLSLPCPHAGREHFPDDWLWAWPVTRHDPGIEIQVTVCQSPLCNLFPLDFFLPPWEQLASESGSLFQNEKILREDLNPTNSLKPGPAEPKQAWSKKFVPIYLQIYEIFRIFCLFVWDFFFFCCCESWPIHLLIITS